MDEGKGLLGAGMESSSNKKHFLGTYACMALILVIAIIALILGSTWHGDTVSQFKAAQQQDIHKFAVKHVPPHTFQRNRGTCWNFAILGMLEHSYRLNGLKKGFLKENEYVLFSEQAYGISFMKECHANPTCKQFGDSVYQNSTEGGEIHWLYYLKNLYDKLLPVKVCPYPWESGKTTEHTCPGMTKALNKNPIKFDVKSMRTAYEGQTTKKMLVETGRALGWSINTHATSYHIPCQGSTWATRPECTTAHKLRVRCPTDRYYNSEYCVRLQGPGYTMDGEFTFADSYEVHGGHAMNVVGFNDAFVTKRGTRGGFIIKNSWEDRVYALPRGPRGSHSIGYWMNDYSEWDERTICPNPFNPRSWLSCVNVEVGPTGYPFKSNGSPNPSLDLCLNEAKLLDNVRTTRQPMAFRCTDPSMGCNNSTDVTYYLESMKDTVGRTVQACFISHNAATLANETFCFPEVPVDFLSEYMVPIASHANLLKNDDLRCGFYFWPYDVLDKVAEAHPGNFYATDFVVEWEDRSYEARQNAKYDYTLLKQSKGIQPGTNFTGPSPFAVRK
eukprot:gnl/Trimastix_PCT/771.p2 GENE.gnl/Trimastix_PCT/771~~gnl/Trimastix_PCT/771.p2  ORF type:complete len:558 (+),score=170.36 gnl/Trimastix_PCT/771:132-1805(+)